MTTTLLLTCAALLAAILVLALCRSRGSADRDETFMRELAMIRARAGELASRIEKHEAAAVGFWRTAKGDVLRIRDMSTGHLRNCINGGFVHGPLADDMAREIARRNEDIQWRALDAQRDEPDDEDYVYLAEREGSGLVFDVFATRELAERFIARRSGLVVRPMIVQTDEED